MSRDKQTEIHELAKQMSEAISTEVEQRYIEDEAKLQAVLRANGWVKAEEIFAEIEEILIDNSYQIPEELYDFYDKRGVQKGLAELKKKYTQGKEEIPPYVRMGAKEVRGDLWLK